jgi:stage IV sporulation protein FB
MELSFRLFGLPVRLNLFFVLIGFVIRPPDARSPALTAGWLVVMFLGVLLHELGHAFAARAFGQQPAILLHGMGGLTYWQPRGQMSAGRRLLIAAAGPAVGVALGLASALAGGLLTTKGSVAYQILDYSVRVNLGWGIFNLLPLLPLDGGQVLASFLELIGLRKGRAAVHVFSLVVGVLVAAYSIYSFSIMGIVLGGLLAYANYTALRPAPTPPPAPPPAPAPL